MYCWIKECGVASPPAECFNQTTSEILCQHGENECLANRIEACANSMAQNATDSVQFTTCFEGLFEMSWLTDNNAVTGASSKCLGESLSYVNPVMFASCVEGAEGQKLDRVNAAATAKYGTSRQGTPWVTVNGEVLQDPTSLLKAVCAAYDGPKPSGC